MHFPAARVADSYGENPHEHKPEQDPFDADAILAREGDECPGSNSSDSPSSGESSPEKSKTAESNRSSARTTGNRSR